MSRFSWRTSWLPSALGLAALAALPAALALACPFCSAVKTTFSEDVASNDLAVIATLVHRPEIDAAEQAAAPFGAGEAPKSTFQVSGVLKGEEAIAVDAEIEAVYYGQDPVGTSFFLLALNPAEPSWNTPLALSERGVEYLLQLPSLPAEGADRLAFFQEYLEDDDPLLAADAYDEFALAPYAAVIDLKDRMPHDKLVEWIKDSESPASRRRLYLTMLGVCGTADDVPMLEEMITSDDRAVKSALDAMIACYLNLKGPDGVPLIVDHFIKNTEVEYADTYAAIMALRFHGQETDVIPIETLQAALRPMLDRPNLADLVIPDLARWQDWSVMEELVALFKNADAETSWVRVPVVNYLRACPLPEAKTYLAELETIDPDAVKRASQFYAYSGGATTTSTEQSAAETAADAETGAVAKAENSTENTNDEAPGMAPAPPPSNDENVAIELADAAPTVEHEAAPSSNAAAPTTTITRTSFRVGVIGAAAIVGAVVLLVVGLVVVFKMTSPRRHSVR